MDKAILKKFAIESRKDLMEKIKNKINTFYIDEEFKKEQKGEIYVLSNEKHSLSLTNEEYQKRELLIKRIKELSLEQVIEEAAYTWFNRIIAIRYMEINDYLPLTKDNQSLGIRVLSSKDNTPDPEILKFTNLINSDLDIDFKKEKYVELKDDNEKFKYVLLLVCKKLGRVIPQVFDGITDYIDILIPDNLLNDTGFITKLINEVPEENYNQVEIIGWLYQYYIFDLKDIYKENFKKYDKKTLPIMTQIFTDDGIVKFMLENTIVNSLKEYGVNIEDGKKFYIKNKIENCNKNIEEFKFIDPCCGSGHILVYAFELLYEAYLKLGYDKNIISEKIINNNIYGIDIDNRASQLAILSLYLKARAYDKRLFSKELDCNVISIVDCEVDDKIICQEFNEIEMEQVKYLCSALKNAKELGSIIKVKSYNYANLNEKLKSGKNIFEYVLKEELSPVIKEAKLLSDKYDVVVTNPPYLGIRYFNDILKKYVEKEYVNSKHDLCTVFMETGLVKDNGYLGMVNQTTWLTQDSFSSFRKKILNNKTIDSMLILNNNIMDAGLDVCTFIMKNEKAREDFITDYYVIDNLDNGIKYSKKYSINNYRFLGSKDCAILYNLSESMYLIYQKSTPLSNLAPTKQGLATSDNNRFLREWYEVPFYKIGFHCDEYVEYFKWYPCNKGGNYRKWYGNFNKIINWEYDGKEIKEYASKLYKTYTRTIKNIPLYFKPGITWNSLAKELGCRIVPKGFIFETKGSMMFPTEQNLLYILGLTNSKVITVIAKIISPTLDFHEGPVGKLPAIINENKREKVENIVKENIDLSKKDWDSFETSWDFKKHPLLEFIDSMPGMYNSNVKVPPTHLKIVKNNYGEDCFIADEIPMKAKISDSLRRWEEYTDKQFDKLKENEEKLNEIFIGIYGLKDELTPEVEDKDITIRKADKEREIKSLISYAVGCMFGRYSLDKEGLIYAGGDFDEIYKKCKKTDGGWAGVSLSNYKVLNDNGQEIDLSFEVDNDNVIPITDEAYFSDDIVERFKTFISVVYGEKTLNENLDFIAETLGKKGTETSEDTIRRYFVNDFFNDHVKTYQKRPIYWLFDSGKKNGFKALVYMHRYNENLIPKVRVDYLHNIQNTYEKLLSDINYKLTTDLSMSDKKEAQKRQADLNAKLQEIKEYDEKIAHIANQRISIDLDDGVKVNYDKFKDILMGIK